jgi:hypothetical protein
MGSSGCTIFIRIKWGFRLAEPDVLILSNVADLSDGDFDVAKPSSRLRLGPHSGWKHSRHLGVVLESVNEKLLALFVGKFLGVALGLIKVAKRCSPPRSVRIILV